MVRSHMTGVHAKGGPHEEVAGAGGRVRGHGDTSDFPSCRYLLVAASLGTEIRPSST